MKKVGILGAGQLGCMLAEALFQYGAEVVFYDDDMNAPGFSRTPYRFCGEWNDDEKLKEFFQACDVVTAEFEDVPHALLKKISSKTKIPMIPSEESIHITQNRVSEKKFLKKHELPVCEFAPIHNRGDLRKVCSQHPFPLLLKSATGGYDGKGQWMISTITEADSLLHAALPYSLIYEETVAIKKEVSCILGRNEQGEVVYFPLFENEHRKGILIQTIIPADISEEQENNIKSIAKKAAEKLNIVGLLTTEFFITEDDRILVNEFAPRPHNSGHVTQMACTQSQFDILARILLNLPITTPNHYVGIYFAMGNIFGDSYGNRKDLSLNCWTENPDIKKIVLYGKKDPSAKRKMGHFIASHRRRDSLLSLCEKFRKDLHDDNNKSSASRLRN
jgi:5-(carboxyamino)imidazole ribonucleotide synthase